jgi:hypothetical protein
VLVATVTEGIGTGVAGPTTLNTALRGVLTADAGAAGAATSAQVSWAHRWAPPFSTRSPPPVTAGYLLTHRATSVVTAQVHGFNVAMVWGVLVLLVAAIPIALLVNAAVSAATPR